MVWQESPPTHCGEEAPPEATEEKSSSKTPPPPQRPTSAPEAWAPPPRTPIGRRRLDSRGLPVQEVCFQSYWLKKPSITALKCTSFRPRPRPRARAPAFPRDSRPARPLGAQGLSGVVVYWATAAVGSRRSEATARSRMLSRASDRSSSPVILSLVSSGSGVSAVAQNPGPNLHQLRGACDSACQAPGPASGAGDPRPSPRLAAKTRGTHSLAGLGGPGGGT